MHIKTCKYYAIVEIPIDKYIIRTNKGIPMADTIAVVELTQIFQDMYAATGITVGTSVVLKLVKSPSYASVSQSATIPTADDIFYPIFVGEGSTTLTAGASGLWARSLSPSGTFLSIQEV